MIFTWIPHTGAETLACNGHPGSSFTILTPYPSTIPGRHHRFAWLALEINSDCMHRDRLVLFDQRSCGNKFLASEIYQVYITVTLIVFDFFTIKHDAVDRHRLL